MSEENDDSDISDCSDQKLSQPVIEAIMSKLGQVDPVIVESLKKRRKIWHERNETVFKQANLRFDSIRQQISKAGSFSNMTISDLSDCLAFLSAYYSHIVELEGNSLSRKIAYERVYNDNLTLLKAIGVVSGRGYSDYRAVAIVKGFSPVLIPLEKEVNIANHDLCVLGINEKKQTSRAEAIKMIIEVFKKRHDSLKDEKMLHGKNRI